MNPPYSIIVTGPSGVGKTSLVVQLIKQQLKPSHIFILCRNDQPLYHDLSQEITLIHEKECPSAQEFEDLVKQRGGPQPVLIADDVGLTDTNPHIHDVLLSCFMRLCHHLQLTVFYICHTLFSTHKSGFLRVLNRNANYILLFRNPRDVNQLRILLSQMSADKSRFQKTIHCIREELRAPHSYILLDFTQSSDDFLRFRTNILGEKPPGYPIILAFPQDIEHLPTSI